MTQPDVPPEETLSFGGLEIVFDSRVLRPRPWTAQQSRWAAELMMTAPEGPVLELCSGAGQIGLLAVRLEPRVLVCVDSNPVACGFARRNARSAGLQELVQVREHDIATAVAEGERFALVIADPPWVPHSDIGQHPADPPEAVDGGPDGLDLARTCLDTASRHLVTGGLVLLQLGTREQAQSLVRSDSTYADLVLTEIRDGERGVLARFDNVSGR